MATYSGTLRDWLSPDDPCGPNRSPQPTPIPKEIPRFSALVIGIDKYAASGSENFKDLKGAVIDAKSVTNYLIENLAVPEANIISLYDEKATRLAIMQGFIMLAQANGNGKGDPILIYFAGHGREIPKPETGEGSDQMIQMIIPHDFGLRNPSDGRPVGGILDRTINTWLEQLTIAKGDNITVILDCCFAGSGTRDSTPPPQLESGDRMRSIKIDGNILPDMDKYIWDDSALEGLVRLSDIPEDSLYSGLRSHVLLAACSAKETAREHNDGGVFTQALIKELIATEGNVSYSDLILRIPCLLHQTPQCEGLNKSRMLWNSKARDTGPCFFNVKMENGEYELNAGMADAITDKAEFAIYQTMNDYNQKSSLGTLVVNSTEFFTSTLVPKAFQDASMVLNGSALAVQTKVGIKEELCLHVADPQLAHIVRTKLEREDSVANQRRISFGKGAAQLSLTTENGFIVFNILNPLVCRWELTRMPFRIKPDWLVQVIQGAAHFDWHLRRGTEDPTKSSAERDTLQSAVKLEFTKVVNIYGRQTAVGDNLNKDDHIDLVVGPDTYGIKLINNSDREIYPYIFFFDCSDLSIDVYYDSATARESIRGAPLQPKSELTIGYGDGGWSPWRYKLRAARSIIPDGIEQDPQDIDVGFMKLFLSTKSVTLSYLAQDTPFAVAFEPSGRADDSLPYEAVGLWGTRLITVVQRKVPAPVPMDIDL